MRPIQSYIQRVFVALLLLSILASCAVIPPVKDLPDGYILQKLGTVSTGSPLAWHPEAKVYACASGGLVVGQLNENSITVDRLQPTALAWSPTGTFLAAASRQQDGALVRIFDTTDWSPLAEIPVGAPVHDLAWRNDGELLFTAVTVKNYSFGGNYAASLYHWRQNEELTESLLGETSPLRSTLDALADDIYDTIHLQISPYRDEIAFTRFVSPPNAETHYQLIVRNLESGRDRVIGKLPFASGGGRYSAGGDSLFYSDGQYQSIDGPIWGTESYETFQPGLKLEISPGGRFRLIDEHLLRDHQHLLDFTEVTTAAFSPDGSSLLIVSGKNLFLLSPLDDLPVNQQPAGARLLELRQWRSKGLISPQDFIRYQKQLGQN